ncbi:MAG: phosphoglycerate kinase [Chloroflexi bacterium]|nr:phosphoglycerate kinase [Chloroflexota bacterium]
MNKKTVRDVNWSGKRALVRCDFNVPLDSAQRITDDRRITEALPTVKYLIEHGAVVVLCSHLGRPKGKPQDDLRLAPVAARLSELLGKPVAMLGDSVGPAVEAAVRAAKPGDVLLLENLRFHAEEEKNVTEYAKALANLGDVYVNDAFGAAHRAHASTAGVAAFLPAVAGFLMEKELDFLGAALENPGRPFVAILGGAKISDKIGVVENLLAKADSLLIGGGMANTFLKAKGYEMGDSLVEADSVAIAKGLLETSGHRLVLPVDAVVADRFAADATHKVVPVDKVQPGWRILDIGPKTVALYASHIAGAKTVVWNGPMGVFEMDAFAVGTFEVAKAVAGSGATSIIGGGDSAAAVEKAGLADQITHISTGGGASLEFLEGKALPGVAALNDK